MSGSVTGGRKAAQTIRRKHGEDFYVRIGRQGGKLGRTGGFASEKIGPDGLTGKQRASKVGVIGGKISRR